MHLAPGSARTRWGSAQAPQDPLAAIGGGVPTSSGVARNVNWGGLPSLVFQVGLLLVETAAPSNLNRPSAFVLYRLAASSAMASCSE